MENLKDFRFKTFEPPPEERIKSLRKAIKYLEAGLEKAKKNLGGAEHGGSAGTEERDMQAQDGDLSKLFSLGGGENADAIKVLEYYLAGFRSDLEKLSREEKPLE